MLFLKVMQLAKVNSLSIGRQWLDQTLVTWQSSGSWSATFSKSVEVWFCDHIVSEWKRVLHQLKHPPYNVCFTARELISANSLQDFVNQLELFRNLLGLDCILSIRKSHLLAMLLFPVHRIQLLSMWYELIDCYLWYKLVLAWECFEHRLDHPIPNKFSRSIKVKLFGYNKQIVFLISTRHQILNSLNISTNKIRHLIPHAIIWTSFLVDSVLCFTWSDWLEI